MHDALHAIQQQHHGHGHHKEDQTAQQGHTRLHLLQAGHQECQQQMRELGMCQRQGKQSQIRSCAANEGQDELENVQGP